MTKLQEKYQVNYVVSPTSNSPRPEVSAYVAIAAAFPLSSLSYTKVKHDESLWSSNIMLKGPSLNHSMTLALLKVNELSVGWRQRGHIREKSTYYPKKGDEYWTENKDAFYTYPLKNCLF